MALPLVQPGGVSIRSGGVVLCRLHGFAYGEFGKVGSESDGHSVGPRPGLSVHIRADIVRLARFAVIGRQRGSDSHRRSGAPGRLALV